MYSHHTSTGNVGLWLSAGILCVACSATIADEKPDADATEPHTPACSLPTGPVIQTLSVERPTSADAGTRALLWFAAYAKSDAVEQPAATPTQIHPQLRFHF